MRKIQENERTLAIDSVRENGFNFESLDDKFKNDREIAIEAIKNFDEAFLHISEELKSCRRFNVQVMEIAGSCLEYAIDKFKDDKEIVMLAVSSTPYTLEFASRRLQNDKDVVLQSVNSSINMASSNLRFASMEARGDSDIILECVKKDALSIRYASKELQKDGEFLLRAFATNGNCLQFCKEYQDNKKFVITAIVNNPESIHHASEKLKKDAFIVSLQKFSERSNNLKQRYLYDERMVKKQIDEILQFEYATTGMPAISEYIECGEIYFQYNRFGSSVEYFCKALEINDISNMEVKSYIGIEDLILNCLCKRGISYHKIREFENGFRDLMKAGSVEPSKFRTFVDVDEERIIDYYSSLLVLFGAEREELKRFEEESPHFPRIGVILEEFYRNLDGPKIHKNEVTWMPYLKDFGVDEDGERLELESNRSLLRAMTEPEPEGGEVGVISKVFRFIGDGFFARTYLCRVRNMDGLFVMKVSKNPFSSSAKQRKMIEKDSLIIPYHRNVVMILSSVDQVHEIDVSEFPDYDDFWKGKLLEEYEDEEQEGEGEFDEREMGSFKTPIILMKYHRKSLSMLLKERKKDNHPFNNLEMCYLLGGLLRGARHLHSNMVVHRDLHPGNIFVDPGFGRVFIGDFGLALDLRKNCGGFKVEKTNDLLFTGDSYYYGGYQEYQKGGALSFLAPEILDYDMSSSSEKVDNDDSNVLDYEKNDLFSVGMIGYYLGSFRENGCAPFGRRDYMEGKKVSVRKGRKQEDYVELGEEVVDSDIARLIKNLLMVDPRERIDHQAAVVEIQRITRRIESEFFKGTEEYFKSSEIFSKVFTVGIDNLVETRDEEDYGEIYI